MKNLFNLLFFFSSATAKDSLETIFVYELIRHGARSHHGGAIKYDKELFEGTKSMDLTPIGYQQLRSIGLKRK